MVILATDMLSYYINKILFIFLKKLLISLHLFDPSDSLLVATAYSNFGNRVKKEQQKLQEKLPELAQKADTHVPAPVPDVSS